MAPLNLEVGAFLIVGGAFGAYLVDSEAQREVAVEAVTLVIAECWLDSPASACIDVAQKLQVVVLVDGPVITAIFQIEASVGRFAIGWHDDTRLLSFRVGNQ